MAHLDKLRISKRVLGAARRRRRPDSVEYRREKLIANLEEQIELANKAIEETPLEIVRKRGKDIARVRPRIWWRTDPDGAVATEVYYGRIPLNIDGRGRTVEVGKLKKLPSIYRTLISAVRAGELDSAIKAARLRVR